MKSLLLKSPINENEPETHYWNGFIAADGSIWNNQIRIELQEQDKDHVTSFSKYFKGIKVHSRFKKQFKKTLYYAGFRSETIANYYNSIGISPNKSLNLNYKGDINWHFIRGVFDGDGSINISKKGYVRIMIYSSSIEFITKIKDFLKKEGFDIDVKNYDNRTKNPFYSIWICGKEKALKLYELMYKDDTVSLERKKNKFLQIKTK